MSSSFTKKKAIVRIVCLLGVAALAAASMSCGTASIAPETKKPAATASAAAKAAPAAVPAAPETEAPAATTQTSEGQSINIFTFDYATRGIIDKFKQMHPKFTKPINVYVVGGNMDGDIVYSSVNGYLREESPVMDIYCLPATYDNEYVKGEYAKYACPYEDLGIDVDAKLPLADVPQHIIDAGTNPDGKVVSLQYASDAIVFMYRRSIAKRVFGTDDPKKIADVIGAGTESWDKFMLAAQTLRKNGCYISSGHYDLQMLVDRRLEPGQGMNPGMIKFMDVFKQLCDSGCVKNSDFWSGTSYDDLNGKGDKPVFGLFTTPDIATFQYSDLSLKETAGDWAICRPPFNTVFCENTGLLVSKYSPNKMDLAPLIEWITLDTSETGLQYLWANGLVFQNKEDRWYGLKGSVVSGAVQKEVKERIAFFGGQNINDILYHATDKPTGKYTYWGYGNDGSVVMEWLAELNAYVKGEKDRSTVLADFAKAVKSFQ